MTWNYRVLHRTHRNRVTEKEHDELTLIEVYYDEDNKITAWCDAGEMVGDDLADFAAEAHLRWEAAERATAGVAVLTLADLPDGFVTDADRVEAKA